MKRNLGERIILFVLLSVTGGVISESASWWPSGEFTVIQKMFDDCARSANDPTYCLKNKAATAVERALSRNISITDDLILVKDKNARDITMNQAMDPDKRIERALKALMRTHTFRVDLTDASDNQIEEGRGDGGSGFGATGGTGFGGSGFGGGGGLGSGGLGSGGLGGGLGGQKKDKKAQLLPYILMAKLTAMTVFGPLAIKTLTIIAGKALLASKIALVISGMLLLKKVFQSDSHESATFQVHTVPDHHRRTYYLENPHPDPALDPYRASYRSA